MFPLPITLILPLLLYTILSSVLYVHLPLSALSAAALSALVMTPILIYMYRKTASPLQGHVQKLRFASNPAACLSVSLLGSAACIAINNLIVLTRLPVLFPSYKAVAKDLYAPPVPVQLVCTGLLIPIVEEFIFRGLFYAPLRSRLKVLPAALISTLAFALYHGNMLQGIYAFTLGLVITWGYEETKTILAPIILHGAANMMSIAVTNSSLSIISDPNHGFITVAAAILSATVTVFCIRSIRRITNNKEEPQ